MGHEIRLHIGQEWSFETEAPRTYPHSINEIAVIDLAKPGSSSRINRLVYEKQNAKVAELDAVSTSVNSSRRRNASTVLYTDVRQGNREVKLYEDCYGLPLVSIDLAEVREALAADWEDSKSDYTGWDKGYRRFYIALKLIDSIIETFPEHKVSESTKHINPLAGKLVAIPWGH
jgi:hypothetical protein